MATAAELRTEFLKLRASGAPLPNPVAVPREGRSSTAAPAREPWEIDREADPHEQARQIAAGVAEMLEGEWSLRPADPGSRRWPTIDRDTRPGCAFYFGVSGGRIEVRGEWPKSDEDGQTFSYRRQDCGGVYTPITCALSRSAESIAADIERRFLPGYFEEWEHALALVKEHDEKHRNTERAARELAAILGTDPHPRYRHDTGAKDHFSRGEYNDGRSWHLSGEVASDCPDGRSIKIEIECTEATARGVLAFLAGLEE